MDCNQILPFLFLGSCEYTRKILQQLNIQAVITVTPEDECPTMITDLEFYRYPISFTMTCEQIKEVLNDAVNKTLELMAQNKLVYLHCYEGINRSATVAIVCVMRTMNMEMNEALAFVKSKRNKINPGENMIACIN